MYLKLHKGQGFVWVILIVAIVALIVLWMSNNSSSISQTSTTQTSISETTDSTESIKEPSELPTSTISLDEIDKDLKALNNGAANIDKGIDDTQLDINQ